MQVCLPFVACVYTCCVCLCVCVSQGALRVAHLLFSGSSTANEMFRVLGQFTQLLERPTIAGAIQQFQSHLLGTVRNDIEALQAKFTKSCVAVYRVLGWLDLRGAMPVACCW